MVLGVRFWVLVGTWRAASEETNGRTIHQLNNKTES